jgi:hypothetical protein
MSLSPGARLGLDEVTAKVGEDGMGEVYQARDTARCGARAGLRNTISAFLFTKGESRWQTRLASTHSRTPVL